MLRKKEKKIRSDDVIMVKRHILVKHIYIRRGGNGTELANTPPPISCSGYTTDVLKVNSYTMLMNIYRG